MVEERIPLVVVIVNIYVIVDAHMAYYYMYNHVLC